MRTSRNVATNEIDKYIGILKLVIFYIIRKFDVFFILSKTTNEKGFYFYFAKHAYTYFIHKSFFFILKTIHSNHP